MMILWALISGAVAADHAVLFVGNSYTGKNDLAGLYATLVAEGQPQWSDVVVLARTPGGYTLAGHWQDAQTPGELLHELMVDPDPPWDFVVLQDQSQIPGFPQDNFEWLASRDGAVGLAGLAAAEGAAIRLYLTWGRFNGDAQNPTLYPDYSTMQGLLVEGYDAYAAAIADAGLSSEIVGVGAGWQLAYDDAVAAGVDPLGDTLFSRLYSSDGSHPSLLGSYLAACIFYGALTGDSAIGLSAPAAMDTADRDALQDLAERVRVGDQVEPIDTGGPTLDTGSQPVDTATTGDPGGDTPIDEPSEEAEATDPVESGGCGCASGTATSPSVVRFLIRRRE